jgi:hypothetical protein
LVIWSGGGAGTEIEFSVAASIAYGTSPDRTLFHRFRRKQGERSPDARLESVAEGGETEGDGPGSSIDGSL